MRRSNWRSSPLFWSQAPFAPEISVGFALQKTWVTYAASAGAEYAVAHGFTAAKIATAATSAAPVSGISISPDPSEFYGCATATGVIASTQGEICPSGTSTGAPLANTYR